ncbi:hypothetical protein [Sporisorium scitamineum]|uniref:RRM domain-containing protein n=1 Tax=Sporisorium scitamineum TaxID=49012 RepID=A0A0F7SA16_9BASI|nr:hypothetical protein [Sporisorium scitamineum]
MAAEKLTKKQQKAAQLKAGKKGKAAAIEDHPATPDDVLEDTPATSSAAEASTSVAATPAAEPAEVAPVKEEKRNKKRKRLAAEAEALAKAQADAGTTPESKEESKPRKTKPAPSAKATKDKADPAANAKKTTFGDDGEVSSEQAAQPQISTTTTTPTETSAKGNKFILFVGNMAFTTTADNISKHFGQACGEVPSVRLLTRKADPNALASLPASKRKSIAKGKAQDPTKPQSKGCAFVEFKSSEALRKALKFHHTMLEGRKINVELTAGGGGKSETRQEKIKAKNAELDKERQKLHGKYVAPKNEARKQQRGGQAKEGDQRPAKRRRGEEGEGASSWGRNSGKERKMPRFMATGSNAVRVAPTS